MNFPVNQRCKGSMSGFSIIELMVAITLGLIVLTAVAVVFANASNTRNEIERVSRQIENGRYAVDLLSQDLRHAGFYGELNVAAMVAPAALPDPCSTTLANWINAMPVHIQAYDGATGTLPSCLPSSLSFQPGTDILVVRRARTCAAGAAGCEAASAGRPYLQVSLCTSETATPLELRLEDGSGFALTQKDCTTKAEKREFFVRMYFVSTNNGQGQSIPTLKRLQYDGAGGWETVSLVEGIEQLNFEYGLDSDGDGTPDVYVANPSDPSGCNPACQVANWMNVVAVQMHVLSRNLEPSAGYSDTKTYHLGDIDYTPTATNFRRHAYSTLVRLNNPAGRRDLP